MNSVKRENVMASLGRRVMKEIKIGLKQGEVIEIMSLAI